MLTNHSRRRAQALAAALVLALSAATETAAATRYRIDASRSRFVVRAFAGGLLWFKGHDHFIAVRDFSGEAEVTPGSVTPASLTLRVRADSLEETRDIFTPQQKQIINRELKEIVLETAKYPEISFRSTEVTLKTVRGALRARIVGDLTLHGVTRRIRIPAEVSLNGRELRARGQFTIDRGDFNVRATSAFHGTVRVRDKLKFTFDIVAVSSDQRSAEPPEGRQNICRPSGARFVYPTRDPGLTPWATLLRRLRRLG
jgi:polyisoprenoid-binding protein YceI